MLTGLQAPRAAPAAPRAQAAPAEPAPAAAAVGLSEALSRLGADDDSGDLLVPLWFKVEAFTAPEFDADEYVRDLRRYVRAPRPGDALATLTNRLAGRPATQVPLETLRAELDKHLTTLKNEARAAAPYHRATHRNKAPPRARRTLLRPRPLSPDAPPARRSWWSSSTATTPIS